MWRAVLIALVGAGALSGCYYDPYTGVLVRLSRVLPLPYGLPLSAGLSLLAIRRRRRQARRRGTRPGPGAASRRRTRRSSGHRCRHRPIVDRANTINGSIDWTRLDNVAADRLWLRPLGLVYGRAAAEAVAAGLARPLAGADLAFTLVAAIGLGSDRRLASVTAPIAELEGWLAGPGAAFCRSRATPARPAVGAAAAMGGLYPRPPARHGRPQCDARTAFRTAGAGSMPSALSRMAARSSPPAPTSSTSAAS